jgi:ribose transport system permease protein
MTCTLKMGDFDLSIGAIAALTGIVTAKILLAGGGIPLALASGLVTGLIVGLVNGVLVAYVGLNAFVCTLAMMSIIFGLCLTVTKGIMLFGLPQTFEFFGRGDVFGVPFRFIFMACLLLVLWFFHNYTPTGRRMEAIGGNPVAAQLSGIKVEANRVIGYLLSGFCAAAAGIFLASSTMSATSTQGGAYLLDAFGAAFIGASTIRVGQFHIPGTFIGVLIVVLAVNGLVILMVPGYLTDMIKGIILLLAILLSGTVGKFVKSR